MGGYTELLGTMRRGTLVEDADNDLAVLIAAVRATGKAGKLTLEIEIAPQRADPSQVMITDKLTLKEPKPEVAPTLAWITADGNLTRRDPRQAELPIGVTAIRREEETA